MSCASIPRAQDWRTQVQEAAQNHKTQHNMALYLRKTLDNKAEIDIDATREWLSKTRDVSSWDDEKVKTANTGTNVFVRANIQIQDAIEDLNFNIYIE